MAITRRRGIIIAGCLFVAIDRASVRLRALLAAPVVRCAVNICRRRVIISNRRARKKRRNWVHGANVTEQKGCLSISRHNIDTHFSFNPPGNFFKQTLRRADPRELFSRDRLRLKIASLFLPFSPSLSLSRPYNPGGSTAPL